MVIVMFLYISEINQSIIKYFIFLTLFRLSSIDQKICEACMLVNQQTVCMCDGCGEQSGYRYFNYTQHNCMLCIERTHTPIFNSDC